MKTPPIDRVCRVLWVVAAIAGVGACTEPRTPQRATIAAPALEARLELSDSVPRAGSEITVRVLLSGDAAARIASFTERVSYDTTGLRYVADVALTDGATRVSNPTPGLIRSAGLRAEGFTGGVLAAYTFVVVNPAAVRRISLSVDELHELNHSDASKSVSVARAPVMRIP
ncbi:MAG TPA: hypothetical protein VK636_00605 [Gemmatimonadaceae bacterium]|nr:hypothetical protein [Gemmatimonadaceae bacterium]